MVPRISHDRRDESMEAKARWFRGLSLQERMRVFCEFYDLALSLNPKLSEMKGPPKARGRVQVLSLKGGAHVTTIEGQGATQA